MLDTLFFLISRLNNACSPLVFNIQINLAIGIKDNPFLSFQLWRLIRRGKQALFNLEIKKKGDQVLISIFTILKFSAQFTQIHAGSWMRTFNSTVHAILNDPSPGMSGIIIYSGTLLTQHRALIRVFIFLSKVYDTWLKRNTH